MIKVQCQKCGYKWESFDDDAKKTAVAAKANKQGPFCSLCYLLEMASRYAEKRGYVFSYSLKRKAR